jgi:serine phosphatase RsbU (regulator of sigma subunit)
MYRKWPVVILSGRRGGVALVLLLFRKAEEENGEDRRGAAEAARREEASAEEENQRREAKVLRDELEATCMRRIVSRMFYRTGTMVGSSTSPAAATSACAGRIYLLLEQAESVSSG